MPDIAAISAALTSLKTATDLAQFLKGSDASIKEAETKLKLAELISALADAKTEMAEIQLLVNSKESEILALQSKLEVKANLAWEKPYYWLDAEAGRDGPFCQQCYDDKGKLIRLQGGGNGYWECATCKSGYKDSSYKPRNPRVGRSRYLDGF